MSVGLISPKRLWAVLCKEFIQMRRDRVTFAMMVVIPIMLLILFGYAINTNPKHLPTAVIAQDHSNFTRAFIYGLKNTDYFKIIHANISERKAIDLLKRGDVQFIISIPSKFTRDLIRGQSPKILVEADATDPVATSQAAAAITAMSTTVFKPLLVGNLQHLRATPVAVNIVQHAKYNPEAITRFNIVPGLLGVVLTMTMILITSIAITRERERGTMESLLSTPVRPLEVMIGKLTPYIFMGYIQAGLILLAAFFLFHVPMQGSLLLLLIASLPFIAANLSIGLTFSSIAGNQLQAVQMTFFFFLPSILLSGFMFPFMGMPQWAQYLGQILPLTHFIRIVRGVMLKGAGFIQIWPDLWPVLIFMVVAISIALKRYHETLD